jgi:virginiamycin B lyase
MNVKSLGRLAFCGAVLTGSLAFAQSQPTFFQYPDTPDSPQAITTGPDGALWFIGYGIGRITTAGVLTEILPAPAVASSGIVTGPDGALWFGDYSSNSIGRITTAGVLTELPIPTPNSYPSRIAAGPDGALWFTESQGNKIGRITTAGIFNEYPVPTANSYPFGITAGPDGALWFTESRGFRIGRITTGGNITEFVTPDFESPGDITVGPDGALWYTAPSVGITVDQTIFSGAIGRITTAGVFTNVTQTGLIINPLGITVGPDGALWFINLDGLELSRITTSGAQSNYTIPNSMSGAAYGITTGPDGALWIAESGVGVARVVVSGVVVPTITPAALPPGGIGLAYYASLSVTGGVPPYSNWRVGGVFPFGLTLDPSSGIITGVPTALGTFNFSVTVQDSGGTISAPQSFSITITQAPACTYLLTAGGQIFSSAGGSGSITVNTAQGCPWMVSGAPSWVTITSGASGAGTGSVNFTVAANNTLNTLDATPTVAGLSFTIQEAASLPDLIPGIPQQFSFAGSMPHLAAEGGWSTTFTFVNKSAASAVARTSLFAPDGTPLVVPVNLPQQPAVSEPFVTSSLDQTIAPNALFVLEASGPANAPYVEGSAQLNATAAAGAVDGFAIFHFGPSAQEAVVPLETRNAPSYLLAFDNTGSVLTGVAIEDVSPWAATIPVIVRDDTGAQIGAGSVPLYGDGHTSFVLSTQFPATANIRGTVEFDTPGFGSATPGQIGVLGIRYTPPGTMTTIPALANVGTTGGSIAHLASGNGWETTFVLVNTGGSAAQATLNFFDDNGNPLPMPLTFPQSQTALVELAPGVTQTLAANSSLWIQSAGPIGSSLLTGSAQLTTTGNISGYAIFRYNPNGQEAVVPMETRNASSYLLAFDNTNGTTTGVALSDVSLQPSATRLSVPVILRDDTGTQIGTASIPLAANGHSSQMLTTLFPASAGIRGTVEFDTPTGAQISVLGIRSPPTLTFTTLPALAN